MKNIIKWVYCFLLNDKYLTLSTNESSGTTSCPVNYFLGVHKNCTECPAGSFGHNCSAPCPPESYGRLCAEDCSECPADECDKVTGCQVTSTVIDGQHATTASIQTETNGTNDLIESTSDRAPVSDSSGSSDKGTVSELIIINGSVIIFFLVILIIVMSVRKIFEFRYWKRCVAARNTQTAIDETVYAEVYELTEIKNGGIKK
ncbi:scavenger receptor class F member 1-like [Saccostrea cucullata]|uniref:scavenger receptor class F member 1-like n=1 Tax=Saccostrea cuccullata TaxID=36930 RepID=UPI002ED54816